MAYSSYSSIVSHQQKYDVFISFRGSDTHETFTSHLHAALCRKKINTSIDDRLMRGYEISEALLTAIEQSGIAIIIFSESYASSPWCLEELAHVFQCKKSSTHDYFVVPVFYRIDPSFVRRQKGSYETAFAKHEDRYKGNMSKVNAWRTALTETANLSGFHSAEFRNESKLIEAVVEDILKKLDSVSPISTELEGLVGVEERMKQVEALICMGSEEIQVVGIWGMDGMGKTTLARAIYNRLISQFDGYCFLQDVRERFDKYGRELLQRELQTKLLNEEDPKYVEIRLLRMRVLIVLDDLNSSSQLEVVGQNLHERFGLGSRMIITTRNKQVFEGIKVDGIYEIEGLNHHEAMLLIQSRTFRGLTSTADYIELFERLLGYAKGIPLLLTILVCSLNFKKSKEEWEAELEKLKAYPKEEIHNALRISYDGIDNSEKAIFLDIACFLKGRIKIG